MIFADPDNVVTRILAFHRAFLNGCTVDSLKSACVSICDANGGLFILRRHSVKSTIHNSSWDCLFGERRNRTRLVICLVIVAGFFFFPRLPFFLYYPIPITAHDTASYLPPLEKLEHGTLPTFELRTPGYPLFWWLCRKIMARALFVIYVQNAITFFSTILILLLLSRYSPQFMVPATFALCVFISSPTHLTMDMSLLTESIYVNSMLLFFVSLYLVLRTYKTFFATVTSLLGAAAIYIRPNASFLIPVLVIVVLILLRRHWKKVALGLVVPITLALAGLLCYNALTIQLLTLTDGGDRAMLWSTAVYLEPDPALPDEINQAIVSKSASISPSDKNVILNSWNLFAFQLAMERNIQHSIVPIARIMGGPESDHRAYLKQHRLCRQIYQTAIRQHPEVYIKNFLAAIILYFTELGNSGCGDFYNVFPARQYLITFVDRTDYVSALKTYYNPKPPSLTLMATPHRLTELYSKYTRVRALLFDNMLFMTPVIFWLILSVVHLMRRGDSFTGSFFVFLMIICLLCHAVLCAAFGHIEKRYTYTLDFVNYLLFALTPFAFYPKRVKIPRQ